jgi:glycolate oxidase FAD binding subunit
VSTTSDTSLVERLAGIVGTEHVSEAPALDVDGMPPTMAVAPGTLEEAARVLLAAREADAAVAPWGGGSGQRIGPPPRRLDLVLHTTRMNGVVEWEPADLTAALETGMTLASVQAALAEQGQQIPVEAPLPERATLGGLLATNTTGPRRWLYGGWRDLVVGMSMALTDGSVIKTGGRVVKNVQGYDLSKLFIGSLGTLGLIGQVNVRLVPLPAARRLLSARGGLDAVAGFLEAVAASQARVSTVDLLDERAARACGLGDGGYAALVLIEGVRAVVDAQSSALQRLADAGARCDSVEGQALEQVWQAWVDSGRVDDLGPDEALLTVSARPTEVVDVIRVMERAAGGRGLEGRCWARAGNGTVYVRVSAPSPQPPPPQAGEGEMNPTPRPPLPNSGEGEMNPIPQPAPQHGEGQTYRVAEPATPLSGEAGEGLGEGVASLQADLLARWPATTIVAGDPAMEHVARPWGAEPDGLAVMRALKRRFDPAGILQPGRYVGGI